MSVSSEMDVRQAIFYLENPLALGRDFPRRAERLKAVEGMDQAIEHARRENSLVWQAYEARRRRARKRVSTLDAARRNVAFERLGARPRDVPAPT